MVQQFENLFKWMVAEQRVDLSSVDIKTAADQNPSKIFPQAMCSINKSLWLQALISTMRSLLDKGTFGLASPLHLQKKGIDYRDVHSGYIFPKSEDNSNNCGKT